MEWCRRRGDIVSIMLTMRFVFFCDGLAGGIRIGVVGCFE